VKLGKIKETYSFDEEMLIRRYISKSLSARKRCAFLARRYGVPPRRDEASRVKDVTQKMTAHFGISGPYSLAAAAAAPAP
jgi:hypothetical protein